MSKYNICLFSSFCDSNTCKNVYERLCQVDLMDNYGPDKEIYITTGNDYTHAIIMNTAMPSLTISKQYVIGLASEPPLFLKIMDNSDFSQFIEYAKHNISKYFIGSVNGLNEPFIQDYSFMWHITPPRTIPQKTRTMSIMVSQKAQAPGHMYRHSLVKEILKTNLDIDIYGRGCCYYTGDKRLKGEFTNDEPYESYHFHICIENFQTHSYTSEKYTNCALWGTTPIYWGATNIDSVFPNITITMSGNVEADMRLLTDIVNNPFKYKKEISQDDIRPKMNILKNLDKLFS